MKFFVAWYQGSAWWNQGLCFVQGLPLAGGGQGYVAGLAAFRPAVLQVDAVAAVGFVRSDHDRLFLPQAELALQDEARMRQGVADLAQGSLVETAGLVGVVGFFPGWKHAVLVVGALDDVGLADFGGEPAQGGQAVVNGAA